MTSFLPQIRNILPARVLRLRRIWLFLFVAWFSALYALSSGPVPFEGPSIPYFDKFAHFGFFAIGGFTLFTLLALAKLDRFCTTWRILMISLVMLAIIGAHDEWHQLSSPGRFGGDLWDWIADLLGATAGCVAGAWLRFTRLVPRL